MTYWPVVYDILSWRCLEASAKAPWDFLSGSPELLCRMSNSPETAMLERPGEGLQWTVPDAFRLPTSPPSPQSTKYGNRAALDRPDQPIPWLNTFAKCHMDQKNRPDKICPNSLFTKSRDIIK